jgi:hypothetical protein
MFAFAETCPLVAAFFARSRKRESGETKMPSSGSSTAREGRSYAH